MSIHAGDALRLQPGRICAPCPGVILDPLLIVSPHYDDAVFSCGNLLAAHPGSLVLTVAAGAPGEETMSTQWDRDCGFTCASQAMQARRLENRQALLMLEATGVDLDFLDSQYADFTNGDGQRLARALRAALARLRPATVVIPMGLYHADHVRVSDVLGALCKDFTPWRWLAYEEIPYHAYDGQLQKRLATLLADGLTATPVRTDSSEPAGGRKTDAVRAYRSQLRGLGMPDAAPLLGHAEQYWKLAPRGRERSQ